MPKKISNSVRIGIVKAHYRRRANGSYEVRCSINKVPITGSGKTLAIAKENFLKNLNNANLEQDTVAKRFSLFQDFAEYWFETAKRPVVKFNTYKSQLSTYNSRIKPYFKGMKLRSITPMQIQPLLNELELNGNGRTAELVALLLGQIFQSAFDERLIPTNPMRGVRVLKHETNKGDALRYDEEAQFLRDLRDNKYRLSFLILLYAGMRRSELPTAQIKDGFIIVQNAKRRLTQRTTFRRIPITPMLQPYLSLASQEEISEAIKVDGDVLSHNFKRLCPAHHLHELRHTFISHCLECGVPREVVSVWAGHAADKTMTSLVYTHFSDEFMLEQGRKVSYAEKLKL